MQVLKFYSRKDVQREILRVSKNREVAVKYGDSGFGKRPDILQFEQDIFELAMQGATSFHISEERWSDPLQLRAGMGKKQSDDLKIGWDLILDVDTKVLEYAKIATELIIEALKFHSINQIELKFSGGTGFHIALPFESFPKEINKIQTKFLFPDGPRVIASYLKQFIKNTLADNLLKIYSLTEISEKSGKEKDKLLEKNEFDPFSVVDIDTVLISNRHMIRSPYSFNEKTGLVSIPLKPNDVKNFDVVKAKPENVVTGIDFLNLVDAPDASQLIIQAFDFKLKHEKVEGTKKEYNLPSTALKEDFFPPCIKIGLNGLEDGRKRFLFILINFLKNVGWCMGDIEKRVLEWNKKNKEPLRAGYVASQLNWHRKNRIILPPNCDNQTYYSSGITCQKDNLCLKIKNPVNYAIRKSGFRRTSSDLILK